VDQLELLLPGDFLDGCLPLQRLGLGQLGLLVYQPDREPTPGVPRGLPRGVDLQPPGQVIRDASVERAVAAAEYVNGPGHGRRGQELTKLL
jgi:hypothetical protein